MKLKLIPFLTILLFVMQVNAQKEYTHQGIYTAAGYEFGFLSSSLKNTQYPFSSSTIDTNINNSLSLTGIYKTPFKAEIKLGYMASYSTLTIKGNNNGKMFDVDNNYFSHTAFIGAGYNIPIKSDIDITVGLGSAISFVKNTNIKKHRGEITDEIVATNNSLKKGNVYIVPEISVTKYLKGHQMLTLGGKYYYSANDAFLEGSIKNVHNGNVVKQVNFDTQNNQIAIYITYGFNLSKLF